MVAYNLSHLTQPPTEDVIGPIQDTEALFLYSVVRGMRMQRVLEIGGLCGYSARNFLEAFADPSASTMYTVDINPVPVLSPRHKVVVKDALLLTADDLDNQPLDLVFFDCHVLDTQMSVLDNLTALGIITDRTVVALHDTNVHPRQVVPWAVELPDGGGWVHQSVERQMVNLLVERGYHAFCLHTPMSSHNDSMPFRHGVTVMQKFKQLAV